MGFDQPGNRQRRGNNPCPVRSRKLRQRFAEAIECIDKRLEKSEAFDRETNARLATINTDLRWIKGVGAFVSAAAIVGFLGSPLYLSNKAGHVEEAVVTLQSNVKGLESESKAQTAKVISAIESLERRIAK